MQQHLKTALVLICSLLTVPAAAWGADPSPSPPPLSSVEANAFSLELAAGTALVGAGLAGLLEMGRASSAKDAFVPARPLFGLALGGALGGAASGVGIALAVDRQPSWWAAAAAGLVGLAAGTGGTLWLDRLGRDPSPDETVYALVSLTLPVVTALLGSLTYQGVRMLTTPQPTPTPVPLQTPWPTPSPPVRLFL